MKHLFIPLASLLIMLPNAFAQVPAGASPSSGWIPISKQDFDLAATQALNHEKLMIANGIDGVSTDGADAIYLVASDNNLPPSLQLTATQIMNNSPQVPRIPKTFLSVIPRDKVIFLLDNQRSIELANFTLETEEQFYGAQIHLARKGPIADRIQLDENHDMRVFTGYLVHHVGINPDDQHIKSVVVGVSYWLRFGRTSN